MAYFFGAGVDKVGTTGTGGRRHIIFLQAHFENFVFVHVQIYEARVNKQRNIEDDRARNEMQLSFNGPVFCKHVVKNAMTQYWRKESKKSSFWHFIRKTERIQLNEFEVSKVVDRKMQKNSKLPFMDK